MSRKETPDSIRAEITYLQGLLKSCEGGSQWAERICHRIATLRGKLSDLEQKQGS